MDAKYSLHYNTSSKSRISLWKSGLSVDVSLKVWTLDYSSSCTVSVYQIKREVIVWGKHRIIAIDALVQKRSKIGDM
jgi:hypothetical protein